MKSNADIQGFAVCSRDTSGYSGIWAIALWDTNGNMVDYNERLIHANYYSPCTTMMKKAYEESKRE